METIIYRNGNDAVKEVSSINPLPTQEIWGGNEVTKTVAFSGAAGNGAVGTVALFTVTGEAVFRLVAYCTENLASAGGGTVEVGVAGNTNGLIAQTTATDIDNGEIWYSNTPVPGIATVNETNLPRFLVVNGADIFATVGTGDVTDGTITFKIYYQPLSVGSSIVAA